MNKHILMIIGHQLNPEKYTQEQLQDNSKSAYDAYEAAVYAPSAFAAYNAATYASWAAAANAAYESIGYWINEYFNITGENKQDYINAINKEAQS